MFEIMLLRNQSIIIFLPTLTFMLPSLYTYRFYQPVLSNPRTHLNKKNYATMLLQPTNRIQRKSIRFCSIRYQYTISACHFVNIHKHIEKLQKNL